MADIFRNGLQWALGTFLRSFIAQVKRVLIFSTVVIVGAVLLSSTWLAVQKVDYSLSSTEREVAVTNKHKWTPHSVVKILRDLLHYVAVLLSSYEPLTLGNLLRHRDRLSGVNYLLQACFNEAIDGFCREPFSVQENSRMVIHCDGQTVQFFSGNGDSRRFRCTSCTTPSNSTSRNGRLKCTLLGCLFARSR
ncbi:uncharacterized protein LOC125435266 isoform X2 [Sphaerodactylus townsendi]|nr:uncharacterized protein LOC125435266 isoform X2 [Sphaerodactylus townsendi]